MKAIVLRSAARPLLLVLISVILFFVIARNAFDASTDFMAFVASRPLATLPLGSGDSIAVLQGSTKRIAGTTYGQTDASNTWTKSNATPPVVLTPGTAVAVNACASNAFSLLISNTNTVLSNPTFSGCVAGQEIDFILTVGGPGGFSGFSVDTNYKVLTSGVAAPTWSTVAGKVDTMYCKAWSASVLDCSVKIDVH